jgi:tetratricopeptide (TPR) repeat protein
MTDSLSSRHWDEIDTLNEQAWQLCDSDIPRSRALAAEAYALAATPSADGSPYGLGLARSLCTLGYLDMRRGDHAQGLSQLLKSLELCEAHRLDAVLPHVLDGIAGIYFQIGDLPTALAYMHRQLAVAEQMGNAELVANAHNNLAGVYIQTGEHERAIAALEQNLEIADRHGFQRMQAIAAINLAETQRMAGNFEQAQRHLRHGLEVSFTCKRATPPPRWPPCRRRWRWPMR